MQQMFSRRERSPSRGRRSQERRRSPTRSPRRAAYRADPATPVGVRAGGRGADLYIRSEPRRQPAASDPWDLARGQHGVDDDVDMDTPSVEGEEEELDGDDSPAARGGGRRAGADGDDSPAARGGGRRAGADGDDSPAARGGGRRAGADGDDSPVARGGGRRAGADGDDSPAARGGGRRAGADGDDSPAARGGGRRAGADGDDSPAARGGGRRAGADGDDSPAARGGGRCAGADGDDSPAARGGGRRAGADGDDSPAARGGGRRAGADGDDSPAARGGGRRAGADGDDSPAARGGGRCAGADGDDSPAARGGGRRAGADGDDSLAARGGGNGERMGEGDGQRHREKAWNEERGRRKEERIPGARKINDREQGWGEGVERQATERQGKERSHGAPAGVFHSPDLRQGYEHRRRMARGDWIGLGLPRRGERCGAEEGGRDGGRERATKVRAWAVAEEEEKDEIVREWAVAEGEEKDEKEEAGVCDLVAAGTEGKNEREGTWACVPAAAEAEEKEEQVGAGVSELAAGEVEERDVEAGARPCVPATADAEGKGVKEGAVKKGGEKELSSTDMGGSGWQPALRTAELFGEIRAGAKTGVTVKDRMQAEEQAQGNKLAEQHVRKLRGGRPELLGEAEQESKECSVCIAHGGVGTNFGAKGEGATDVQTQAMRKHQRTRKHRRAVRRQRTAEAALKANRRIDDNAKATGIEKERLISLFETALFLTKSDAQIEMFVGLVRHLAQRGTPGFPKSGYGSYYTTEALAAKDAAKALPEMGIIDAVIRAVAEDLGRSKPYNHKFKELQEVFTHTNLEVQGIHSVRWLSRGDAIARFVRVLPAVIVLLEETDAAMYLLVTLFKFHFFLFFLAGMHTALNALNLRFQKRHVDLTAVHSQVRRTIIYIEQRYLNCGQQFGGGTSELLSAFLARHALPDCREVIVEGVDKEGQSSRKRRPSKRKEHAAPEKERAKFVKGSGRRVLQVEEELDEGMHGSAGDDSESDGGDSSSGGDCESDSDDEMS
ncbi:unnamed protein product [Closterium sp. Naga37s-1]|nr:unnamed protein product [Closterium sp. Naga37s-1]